MPNIEIHGLSELNSGRMAREVAKCLLGASFADEAVITSCNDAVMNLRGEEQPYLRICCSIDTGAEQVIKLLKPLNIDVEVLRLDQFVPKSS
jgi:hypothetical protein